MVTRNNKVSAASINVLGVLVLLWGVAAGSVHVQAGQSPAGETYIPEVERDRVTRYSHEKKGYTLQPEDIGSGTLTVRVHEHRADGGERVYDVRDFDLNVSEADGCDAPQVTPVYPAAGQPVYNIFDQAGEIQLTPASEATAISESSYTGEYYVGDGEAPYYTFALYRLTLSGPSENIGFYVAPANIQPQQTAQESANFDAYVYIDDGYVDLNDLVNSFRAYGQLTGQNEVYANAELSAGTYIIAISSDYSYADDVSGSGGSYLCWNNYACSNEETITIPLTVVDLDGNEIIKLESYGSPVFSSAGDLPVDFRPLSFNVSAPSGLSSVEFVAGGQQQRLRTLDGVRYFLDPANSAAFNIYRNTVFGENPPADVTINAESNCGATAQVAVSLNSQPDPTPSVSVGFPQGQTLELAFGEQTHIPAQLQDAGRNVQDVYALLYPVGQVPVVSDITPDNYREGTAGELGGYRFFERFADGRPLSVDSTNVEIPVSVLPTGVSSTGDYDLRVLALDHLGQAGISEAIPVSILPPVVPPYLDVTLPEGRIPAGEIATVTVNIEHLGPLDRLEVQVGGAAADPGINTIDLEQGIVEYSTTFDVRTAMDAQPGDVIDLTVSAVAQGGKTSTFIGQIEVGLWGERTITIPAEQGISSGIDMRYADIVIQSSGALFHSDPGIRFNSILVEGDLVTGSDWGLIDGPDGLDGEALSLLDVHERIEVTEYGYLDVPEIQSFKRGGDDNRGGAHGGDSGSQQAYDRIREPVFPGASGGSYYNDVNELAAGGGALEIRVPELVLNGTIYAKGSGKRSSSSNYLGGGAGGSILIRSENITGSGEIDVNGGDGYYTSTSGNNYSGAGGRIAIYYDSYGDGSVPIDQGLSLQAYPGTTPAGPGFTAAPGTVFLKQTAQQYGDLIVDAYPGYEGGRLTTLPMVGFPMSRRWIEMVESAGEGLYRITTRIEDGGTYHLFAAPNAEEWESGLVGLQVSLDADNRDALLYTIIDNNENSFVVASDVPLTGLEGNRIIGVQRFDSVRLGEGVWLASQDRLYASSFDLTGSGADGVEAVAELRSDQIFNLSDYALTGETDIRIGDVSADSMAIDNGALVVHGLINVGGEVSLTGGANLDARDSLNAGSATLDNNSELIVAGTLSTTGGLDLGGNANLVVARAVIGGNLNIVNDARLFLIDDLIVNGNLTIDNGTLEGNAELHDYGQITVSGDVQLENNSRLYADSVTVDNNANFLIEQNSYATIDGLLNVSGSIQAATGASLTSRYAQANVIQFDGDTAAVRFRTERATADLAIALLNSTTVNAYSPYGLPRTRLEVPSGTFLLDDTSVVDLSGIANQSRYPGLYPECSSGTYPAGSHIGRGAFIPVPDCVYDRYDLAVLPGSGYNTGLGGGVIEIAAETATVNGSILVNGAAVTNSTSAAAGGSINVQAVQAFGGGTLQANGGDSTYSSNQYGGGGGAVVVAVDQRQSMDWIFSARGGHSGSTYSRTGGAGTVLTGNRDLSVKQSLTIANGGYDAGAGSTPLRAVGSHFITGITLLTGNSWQIDVDGFPWTPSDTPDDRGIAGMFISLDAANPDAPRYRVISNTASSLLIETPDDLSSANGNDLIGVHEFETLIINDGAHADFGSDRIIVHDTGNSDFDVSQINAVID